MAHPRKFLLDTTCFIDATKDDAAAEAYERFTTLAAPRLYLSAVVAAELRAGAVSPAERKQLEHDVLGPYERRGRVVTPSARAWEALGTTFAALVWEEGLRLKQTPRSFIFDILLAFSCREIGATLISANTRDLTRIARVFPFDFVAPYPDLVTT